MGGGVGFYAYTGHLRSTAQGLKLILNLSMPAVAFLMLYTTLAFLCSAVLMSLLFSHSCVLLCSCLYCCRVSLCSCFYGYSVLVFLCVLLCSYYAVFYVPLFSFHGSAVLVFLSDLLCSWLYCSSEPDYRMPPLPTRPLVTRHSKVRFPYFRCLSNEKLSFIYAGTL